MFRNSQSTLSSWDKHPFMKVTFTLVYLLIILISLNICNMFFHYWCYTLYVILSLGPVVVKYRGN